MTGLVSDCTKRVSGVIAFIKTWTESASNPPHVTIKTTLYQILYQLQCEMSGITQCICKNKTEAMFTCTLLDLKAVMERTNNLVRKSHEAAGRIFGKAEKYIGQIAVMCNRLYYIYQLFYYFTNPLTYSFRATYVISDKEAAEFWTRNFGDSYWYKEYGPFCDAIKIKNEKAQSMLLNNNDKAMKYPQVVTAISFGLATDDGFKAFFNGLSRTNPFLVPVSTTSASISSSQDTDSVGVETGRGSEYFFIVSACVGVETNVCVQVSGKIIIIIIIIIKQKSNFLQFICLLIIIIFFVDKEPGSNIVIGELNYSDAQQWKWGENGSLINRMSMLAIDIDGRDPKSGKKLVQWPADGSATQMWLIGNDGYIHSGPALNEPICFDLDKGATTIGTPCLLWNIIPGRANQLWRVSPVMNKIFKKYVDED